MRPLLVLVLVLALASLLYLGLRAYLVDRARRPAPWKVETISREDGALAVVVQRASSEPVRAVRELPAGLDPLELAGELRLAREEAQLIADELNRES